MSGAGFNGIEALRSRVWTLKPSASDFEMLFCDGIVNVYVRSSRVLMDVKTLGQKFGKGVL